MKQPSKNQNILFKIILLSYLKPKSRKPFWKKIRDVYLPNIMKSFALSCLLLTILTWMGLNTGLKKEYERFKKDPYTTSIFINSNRFTLSKEQVYRAEVLRYDTQKDQFNTEGRGEAVYSGKPVPFSSLDLIFYEKNGIERKSFTGRTVSQSDEKILRAIAKHFIRKKSREYDFVNHWHDSERGIVVSRYLLERLGYKIGESFKIYRLIDKRFNDEDYSFQVPVTILAVVERMPFGDFIVSEEFNYNRIQDTFNPFDPVTKFYVFTSPQKEKDLEPFVKSHFKFFKKVIEINRSKEDNLIRCEVVLKNVAQYRKEYSEWCEETSKINIIKQFKDSGFQCSIDFYDWQPLPETSKKRQPEFLTLYLKEKYIDHLDQLCLFFRESIGGIEMDDTVLNIFENYHKDMRRFRKISGILYVVLIGLGIFVSIAIYIKSVQATMHRLGVFSAFGVSADFLSVALAVESVVYFLGSSLVALVLYLILPPLLISKEIAMKMTGLDLGLLVFIGSLLSFLVVFRTVKSMLKKPPYLLMEYRS